MIKSSHNAKLVALFIMPLVFALSLVGVLYLTLYPVAKPYVSMINLFVTVKTPAQSQSSADLFVGYTGNNSTENPEEPASDNFISEDDFVFPKRGDYYAQLKINRSDVTVKIYFDDTPELLNKGAGQYYGSHIPGYGRPILIGGHNNSYFNSLQYTQIGDIITITTNYGVFEYKVTETAIKLATDPAAYDLGQENEQLILYTCYPFTALGLTQKRYFVYADKVSGPMIKAS